MGRQEVYILVAILILLGLPTAYVYGDGDGEDIVNTLGSMSWEGGLILNTIFVAVNRARKYLGLRLPYRLLLNIHIGTNIYLGLLGLLHGYIYISRAGPIEYFSALLILFVLVTGLILRYVSVRDLKLLNRLVHTQLGLALLLAISIWLHIQLIED